MKTQISKPARERAGYTNEYKQEALSLWRASGRSAAKVAAELGIRPPLLYRWARSKRMPEAGGGRKPRRSLEELEAEIQRLRTENAKLLEQREVLKKSLGVELGTLDGVTVLAIEDSGRGFARVAGADGMGLRNMEYRANVIGAKLVIGPRAGGRGTRIVCTCLDAPSRSRRPRQKAVSATNSRSEN